MNNLRILIFKYRKYIEYSISDDYQLSTKFSPKFFFC